MIKKRAKQLTFILIILCYLGFLTAILFEKQNNYLITGFLIIALILLFVTYKKTPLSAKNHTLEHILTISFVFFGAIITYLLHTSFGFTAVLAASVVGLVISFLPNLIKNNTLVNTIPTAVYCGAFVGMTNASIAPDYVFISLASLFTGVLLVGSKGSFNGVGGKLGTLAFGGVVLAFFITFLLS
ncbi:hypothetical protein AX016_2952 [Cellulophaga sp. RHA19]|uniref:hypothetical protein n=1 Tax=Cellulophaga sp. RHA19 TaxID=1798237 RepID=UPI000C2BF065|nr:hypothetical protein [Cellulophaga sp. RHA19]PKB44730.1 hypothetical protein AX016_2952 [Cellulophaga sp. RHA19]